MAQRGRLVAADWIGAGMAVLARDGHGALRIDTLARRLGATKGSFYWHFADWATYRTALLGRWAEMPPDSARDLAMRRWGGDDQAVAAMVGEVDACRIGALVAAQKQKGRTDPALAIMLYAARLGLETLVGPDDAAPLIARIERSLAG